MITVTLALIIAAADAPAEPPPYALDRKQFEILLRSLGRPATNDEIDEAYQRLLFFRPPSAAPLLHNPVFVAEMDDLWKQVFGRPPTAVQLFDAARDADLVSSPRYMMWTLGRWKDDPELTFACVVKDLKGEPVRKALLIETSAGVVRCTDADGRAFFQRPNNGNECTVYQAADEGYHVLYDEISRSKGMKPPEYVLRRHGGGTVTGFVHDRDGRPIAQARVRAAYGIDRHVGWMYLHAISDAAGRFVVKWIHPDAYVENVSVTRRGFVLGQRRFIRNKKVLPPDYLSNLDFELEPSARIAGRVVDESGRPVAAAAIRTSKDSIFGYACATDLDGRFVLDQNIRAGECTVIAERREFALAWKKIAVQNAVPAELTLTLTKGAYIRGRVVNAADKPVVGARVRSPRAKSFFGFADDNEFPRSGANDVTDEQGRFELGPLQAGTTYEFRVYPASGIDDFTGVAGGPEVLCRVKK